MIQVMAPRRGRCYGRRDGPLRHAFDARLTMGAPWSADVLTIAAMSALYIVLVLLPPVVGTFDHYRRRRTVFCPDVQHDAELQIDARHAALTAVPGPPALRVRSCSLWPERAGCGRDCVRPSLADDVARRAADDPSPP